MFIIGIDPHKGSHTAAVLDRSESVIAELRVVADRRQQERLLRFAADFTPRTWAIEAASGLGALLAQQLISAGGCTPEHLAAVTGFDVEVVKRLLHKPRQEFNGRHPTDRHAPGQERFYR